MMRDATPVDDVSPPAARKSPGAYLTLASTSTRSPVFSVFTSSWLESPASWNARCVRVIAPEIPSLVTRWNCRWVTCCPARMGAVETSPFTCSLLEIAPATTLPRSTCWGCMAPVTSEPGVPAAMSCEATNTLTSFSPSAVDGELESEFFT